MELLSISTRRETNLFDRVVDKREMTWMDHFSMYVWNGREEDREKKEGGLSKITSLLKDRFLVVVC